MSNSISVKIAPMDSRCRYWAKVIRAGAILPLPSGSSGRTGTSKAYPTQN